MARRRTLKKLEAGLGMLPPPPPPPRIQTTVGVPWFSREDEWPAYIEATRAMLAKSGFATLVDNPRCQRIPTQEEDARFEQYMMAYQRWLTGPGSELGAMETVSQVCERLREQYRDWKPPTEQQRLAAQREEAIQRTAQAAAAAIQTQPEPRPAPPPFPPNFSAWRS